MGGRLSANSPSARELEIIRLVALGDTNPEIAQKLWISRDTVKTHLWRMFRRFDCQNRAHLTAHAIQQGWL